MEPVFPPLSSSEVGDNLHSCVPRYVVGVQPTFCRENCHLLMTAAHGPAAILQPEFYRHLSFLDTSSPSWTHPAAHTHSWCTCLGERHWKESAKLSETTRAHLPPPMQLMQEGASVRGDSAEPHTEHSAGSLDNMCSECYVNQSFVNDDGTVIDHRPG